MAKKSSAARYKEYEDFLFSPDELEPTKYFHTGVLALDTILTPTGGIPGGSIVQLLGENGHGKSTLSYDLIAQAQRNGLKEIDVNGKPYTVAVLDIERSFDRKYAERLGIDWRKVLIIRTDYIEDSFTIAEKLLLDGIQFVLVDSIGMMVAADEADKEYTDNEKMAAEAKALGRFTKRVNAFMGLDTLVVVINHYRANLNKMGHAPDKKAYGARIVQYAVKLTVELRKTGSDGDRDHIAAFITKNKLGGKKGLYAEFDIVSGEGIDYWNHVLKLAVEFGIITKSVAWYYYGDIKVQGEKKTVDMFPIAEITDKVRSFIKENNLIADDTTDNDDND